MGDADWEVMTGNMMPDTAEVVLAGDRIDVDDFDLGCRQLAEARIPIGAISRYPASWRSSSLSPPHRPYS